MSIRFHHHALERMKERGATKDEVLAAIRNGEHYPAKLGRTRFRLDIPFMKPWMGKYYSTKRLDVFTVNEVKDLIVITVIVRYF